MSPSRRRAIARGGSPTARGGSPPRCAAWQVAHAESFACRGSVRGTVCGRAAHPARCPYRAAITPAKFARALPCGAMGTSRPTAITHARGAPPLPTRITHGHEARHYAREIRTPLRTATGARHYARGVSIACIRYMTFRSVKSEPDRSPVTFPSLITRDRWQLPRISPRSEEMRRMATPVAASPCMIR